MPRKATPLTAASVKSAQYEGRPRKHFDGAGLHLLVNESGKYWRYKYSFAGRERLLALGKYPDVSLKDARTAAADARQLLTKGIDPSAERKKRKAAEKEKNAADNTFRATAEIWWRTVHSQRVSTSQADRNRRRLEMYLYPYIGEKPVSEVTASDLLDALKHQERRGRIETAYRARTLAGQVFRYAVLTGRAERDVAADLRDALATRQVKHHPALVNPTDLALLLRAIEGYGGQPSTRAALRLAPLLFVRPGELRTAVWQDFDLPAGEWEYRPSKGGAPMVTPLPRQAVEILREQHALTGPEGYVFPSMRGKGRPMSENTVNGALHQLGYAGAMTAHGFRATARTVLVERLDFPVEPVEMQLGHAVRDPNGRAYNRTTYLEQRRGMLQRWADYLDELREGTVPLKQAAA